MNPSVNSPQDLTSQWIARPTANNINAASASNGTSNDDPKDIESYDGFEGFDDRGMEESAFPIDCLPGIAGEMAKEVARVSTARNEALSAACVLGVVSAAIGGSLEIVSGPNRKTRGNLFLMPVASSGTGKTESFKMVAKPLEEEESQSLIRWEKQVEPGIRSALAACEARINHLIKRSSSTEDVSLREKLALELQEEEAKRSELTRSLAGLPCISVGDATKEKLAILMQAQPKEAIASMSSEARGIVSVVRGRYSISGDIDFYTAGYSGDAITVDRTGRAERIRLMNPCLTILWMLQEDVATSLFSDPIMALSGFLPRFLAFNSHAEPRVREADLHPIPDSVITEWTSLIRDLLSLRSSGVTQPILASSEAQKLLLDFDNENILRRVKNGDCLHIAPYAARWSENAWKLCVVLHAAEHGIDSVNHELSAGTASSAIRLMRWFSIRQVDLTAGARRKQLLKRISDLERAVVKDGKETSSMRDLKKNNGFTEEEVRQLARNFPERVTVWDTQNPNGGPSSTIVSFTPRQQNPRNPHNSCYPENSKETKSGIDNTKTIPFFIARVV